MTSFTRYVEGDTTPCKVYSRGTDSIQVIHSEVITGSDDPYDNFLADWMGNTPNAHQWGYCIRCGQRFRWLSNIQVDTGTENILADLHRNNGNWGWIEVSREQVEAAYGRWLRDVRDGAISDIHDVRRILL